MFREFHRKKLKVRKIQEKVGHKLFLTLKLGYIMGQKRVDIDRNREKVEYKISKHGENLEKIWEIVKQTNRSQMAEKSVQKSCSFV